MFWGNDNCLCYVHLRDCLCGCKHRLILPSSVMSYHDYHRYVLLYYIYHKIRLIILEPKKLSNIAIVDTKILESISKLADEVS